MLVRQTLLYLPAQIAGPLAQLVAAVVWTHWLSPTLYGQLTFVMAAQDLVFLLCLSWWSQFTVRHLSGQRGETDRPYRETEGAVLAVATLAQAAATLAILAFITTPLTPSLAITAMVYTVTRSLGVHLGERARARGRVLAYTVAQTVGPVVGFGFAFLAVSRLSPTPHAALAGYGLAQAGALAWLARDLGLDPRPRRPDGALIRRALVFGLPLVLAGAAAWVGANAIRVIVDRLEGAEAMGLVAVGWGLGQRLTTTVAMCVTVAAFPLAMRSFSLGSKETAVARIAANGILMLGLVMPAAVGFVLVAGPLVRLFVAAPFQATTLAVIPFAVAAGVARNLRGHIADQAFILVDAPRMVLLINGLEAIGVVAGCLGGLALAGPVGAAAGCAGGYGIVLVIGFVLAGARTGLRPPSLEAGAIGLAVVFMALALMLPPWERLPGGQAMRLGLEILTGIIVYAGTIAVLFPKLSRDAARRRGTLVPPDEE